MGFIHDKRLKNEAKENGLKAQTELGQRPEMNINSVRLGLAGSPGSHDDESPIIYIHGDRGQHFPAKIKRDTERWVKKEAASTLNQNKID